MRLSVNHILYDDSDERQYHSHAMTDISHKSARNQHLHQM